MKKIAAYLDESEINRYQSKERARALKGAQVYGAVSGMRYARESFIATQRNAQILSPFCYRRTRKGLYKKQAVGFSFFRLIHRI